MNRCYLGLLLLAISGLTGFAYSGDNEELKAKAQSFLNAYTKEYLSLYALAAEAQWASNTLIIEGDQSIGRLNNMAMEAMSAFSGSTEVIGKTRALLKNKDKLKPIQVKQLQSILYAAANSAQTIPEVIKERIAAETEQVSRLYGYTFEIDGKEVTPNEIQDILVTSNDPAERLAAWESSKDVGTTLKKGLAQLVDLRNKTVRALDYKDYFDYQVSDYGMTSKEMMTLLEGLQKELRPLYRELHTWARYHLAEKYGAKEVPEMIPAHWLPNRWGQDWGALVTVEGIDLDGILSKKEPEWLIKQAERFYVSLGFDPLPQSFWDQSSLYPVSKDAGYKKNTHASAWHMNLNDDVRCLMSVVPNAEWYETTHHELGHIYYYISYTNDRVPPLLRGGANRAFHEGVGSLLGMASMQKPFLQNLKLVDADIETDQTQTLLKEALEKIIFIPFSAGVMPSFEHDLYKGLSVDEYNARWWSYVQRFQGIAPPSQRGEDYCDAATKTHINDDPAQYYDYALSYIILFQLHDYIAGNILKQNPHATNYYGSKEVGAFLAGILEKGATEDWRKVMKDTLGEGISARAMLNYYQPLMDWLKEQNKGRKHTLAEL